MVDKKWSSQSLGRSLDILESFGPGDRELGLAEIARRVRLPKSTTHRFVATLVGRGYLSPDGGGRYRLGIRLWELGCLAVMPLGLREAARPTMEWLARESRETIHLAVLDGPEVVYIDRIESTQPLQARSRLGGRMPAYCVATGKAMAAHASRRFLGELVARGLRRYTPRTITDPGTLQKVLAAVARNGYAVTLGEYERDLGGVAAPIREYTGALVGGIGVVAPLTRLARGRYKVFVPLVIRAAAEVSARLGYGARRPAAGPATGRSPDGSPREASPGGRPQRRRAAARDARGRRRPRGLAGMAGSAGCSC